MMSTRDATDWGLFALLTVIWASAYAMTRVAVQTAAPEQGLPVEVILASRLTLGSTILYVATRAMGHRLPPLSDLRMWGLFAVMGGGAMTLPFFLITTAQQTVDSSLAALYTAAAPIFVAIGAHAAFHSERLTGRRVIGILVGFAGVGVLFGPDAIANWGSASVTAQLLLVIATGGYAAGTLIARAAPTMPAIVFAAGYVTCAALLSWPLVLLADTSSMSPAPQAIAAVIGLGIGPSAAAALLYPILVKRAGPNFLALTGYSIPLVSAAMGWVFFRETQSWNAVLAFALILGGVWLAQRSARATSPTSTAETAPRSP